MEKFEVLPERVGKKEKSLRALAPMAQRLVVLNQDALEFHLPRLFLKMEFSCPIGLLEVQLLLMCLIIL